MKLYNNTHQVLSPQTPNFSFAGGLGIENDAYSRRTHLKKPKSQKKHLQQNADLVGINTEKPRSLSKSHFVPEIPLDTSNIESPGTI